MSTLSSATTFYQKTVNWCNLNPNSPECRFGTYLTGVQHFYQVWALPFEKEYQANVTKLNDTLNLLKQKESEILNWTNEKQALIQKYEADLLNMKSNYEAKITELTRTITNSVKAQYEKQMSDLVTSHNAKMNELNTRLSDLDSKYIESIQMTKEKQKIIDEMKVAHAQALEAEKKLNKSYLEEINTLNEMYKSKMQTASNPTKSNNMAIIGGVGAVAAYLMMKGE